MLKYPILLAGWCALLLFTSGCATSSVKTNSAENVKIGRVFFAQQHVLEPDSPYFTLVSDLPALVKVQVYSKSGAASPVVVAIIENGAEKKELRLKGPSVLPKPYKGSAEMLPQSFDDSFTGLIPKAWVKPGLSVSVELRTYDYLTGQLNTAITVLDKKSIGKLKVGAPNVVKMTMFDFHFFGNRIGSDYPDGWLEELQAKLPVSKIELQRVRGISLKPFSMFPRLGKPAIKAGSLEDYEKIAGGTFDGEQRIALMMLGALQQASGYHGFYVHHVGTIAGVHSGGQARGYFGVANLHRNGVLIHELGHTFGLPHWGTRPDCPYPFKGSMCGIPTKTPDMPHVGPDWAFDLSRMAFISPFAPENPAIPSRCSPGDWKLDPMRGGGTGDQESCYIFRHFSSYSVHRMQNFTEQRNAVWDEASKTYLTWAQETNSYSKPVKQREPVIPVAHNVSVISLLCTLSGVTPEANHVYPPIGPYTSGLPRLFNAESAEDRKDAEAFGFTDKTCNVSTRVTQDGHTTTYLLRAAVNRSANPKDMNSFRTSAINLPAGAGDITRVQLLYTPDVVSKGLGEMPEVLGEWKN